VTSPAASCTPIEDRNFAAGILHLRSTATTWSDRWAGSAPAGDNAAMESFFALLQKNVLDRHAWATRDELRIAIVTWIERTYHRRRAKTRPRPIDPRSSSRPS
jgi:putative transposase